MKLADLVARYLGQPGALRQFQFGKIPSTSPSAPVFVTADLPPSQTDWPSEWREAFNERAGILEFDGNLPRATAEQTALASVREAFRRQHVADIGRRTGTDRGPDGRNESRFTGPTDPTKHYEPVL